MRNQRGFVSAAVLIAIALGLLVVGGGAYYVVRQQSTPQTSSDNFDNLQQLQSGNVAPTNQPAVSQTSNTSTRLTFSYKNDKFALGDAHTDYSAGSVQSGTN